MFDARPTTVEVLVRWAARPLPGVAPGEADRVLVRLPWGLAAVGGPPVTARYLSEPEGVGFKLYGAGRFHAAAPPGPAAGCPEYDRAHLAPAEVVWLLSAVVTRPPGWAVEKGPPGLVAWAAAWAGAAAAGGRAPDALTAAALGLPPA